jgi:phosphatidylserine/phosphatidylglycerophosphate/cardiolipin synthase-like enzyme
MKSLTCALFLTLIYPVHAEKTNKNWQVYFSPRGGCTEAVVETLSKATTSVIVQAYSFTSKPIAEALVNAKKRGINVQVILDSGQRSERYTSATFLIHAAIPTYIDDRHSIAHNKVMVIDGHVVITGSFNFTKNAEENNAENLLVIDDAEMARKYAVNWNLHLKHSNPYEGPAEPKSVKSKPPTFKLH